MKEVYKDSENSSIVKTIFGALAAFKASWTIFKVFGALWCKSLVWDLCGVSKVILETNGIYSKFSKNVRVFRSL